MSEPQSLYWSVLPYLVGISVATDTDGDAGRWVKGARRFVLSGSIFDYRGLWFLATAGHVLSNLDKIVRSGGQLTIALFDGWSADKASPVPVPLHYDPAWAFSYDDNKIDFGIILLPENTRALLESNGVQPIGPQHHNHEPDDDRFERCAVLGIPSSSQSARPDGDMIALGMAPTLVQLEHRFEIPEPVLKKGVPLWYGRFLREDEPDFGGMDGMSGGPVFGFRVQDDGGIWFQVIGIQYAVRRHSKYTYVIVTPWFVVSHFLDEIIRRVPADGPKPSEP